MRAKWEGNRGQTTVFSATKINVLIAKYIYIFYEKPWSVPDIATAVMADVNLAADAFHRSFTEVIPANALHSAANDAVSGVRRAAA